MTTKTKVDGRQTIQSPSILQARPIREANRKLLVDLFLTSGKSVHSKLHGTLAYIIDYCEKENIPYILTAAPSQGYLLERMSTENYFTPERP